MGQKLMSKVGNMMGKDMGGGGGNEQGGGSNY